MSEVPLQMHTERNVASSRIEREECIHDGRIETNMATMYYRCVFMGPEAVGLVFEGKDPDPDSRSVSGRVWGFRGGPSSSSLLLSRLELSDTKVYEP